MKKVERVTDSSIHDCIFATKEKPRSMRISGVRNLFVPEGVSIPVEVSLQEVGDSKFSPNEELHYKLQALHRSNEIALLLSMCDVRQLTEEAGR